MKQGSFHAALEKGLLWTVRWSIVGSRTVAIIDLDDIKAHMKKAGIVGMNSKDYVKEIGAAGAQEFFKQGFKAWVCTIASVGAGLCAGAGASR